MNEELIKFAARMKELGEQYDKLKEELSVINQEYDDLRLKKIPELMAEMNIRTVTFEGIGRVQLAADAYVSMVPDHKVEAYDWLRSNNYGDLIQETVNSSTLKAWAKEQLKAGNEPPEEFFKVTPFTRASIVKG